MAPDINNNDETDAPRPDAVIDLSRADDVSRDRLLYQIKCGRRYYHVISFLWYYPDDNSFAYFSPCARFKTWLILFKNIIAYFKSWIRCNAIEMKICEFGYLCPECEQKRTLRCELYHLEHKKEKWNIWVDKILNGNFVKIPNVAGIREEILKYSLFEVEYALRKHYERSYIVKTNANHNKRNKYLKKNSIALSKPEVSKNFWTNLIFHILLNRTVENDIDDVKNKYGLITITKLPLITQQDKIIMNITKKYMDKYGIDTSWEPNFVRAELMKCIQMPVEEMKVRGFVGGVKDCWSFYRLVSIELKRKKQMKLPKRP